MTTPNRVGPKPRRGTVAGVRFEIRLTDPERSRWQEAADREHLTLAEFVREAVETCIARGSSR